MAELRTQDVVEYPSYDFATSSRKKTECNQTKPGVKLFIFEGIFAHHPLVKALYDVTIFVDTNPGLCLDRRIARDIAERGGNEEKVRQDWDNFVYPAYKEHILPRRDEADIVVSNNVNSREFELDLSGLLFSLKSCLSGAATGRVSCSLFPRTTTAQNEFAFAGLDSDTLRATAPSVKR